MLETTMEDIEQQIQEHKLYLNGRSGSFTTALYDAIRKADMQNQYKLAKVYPAHVLVHKLFCDGPYSNIYMSYKVDGERLEDLRYEDEETIKFKIAIKMFGSIEAVRHAWCLDKFDF